MQFVDSPSRRVSAEEITNIGVALLGKGRKEMWTSDWREVL